jgi:modulator of FtsH protease HflK
VKASFLSSVLVSFMPTSLRAGWAWIWSHLHLPVSVVLAIVAFPALRLAHWARSVRGRPAYEGSSEMSLNDPQWGKRPSGGGNNDGPPDLDEIIRKFNQKLASLFGGGKPPNNGANQPDGSGGGMTPPSAAALGGGAVIAVSLVLAVWLATGFYQVEQNSRGIELRLGKYSQTTMPGLKWRWPYPIETHEIVNVTLVRALEVGHRNNQKTKKPEEALMLTEDQNIVDVQFAVQYTVKSPEQFLFQNQAPEETVRQVAESAMREIVGRSKMDFVLYEGRGEIGARAKTLMQTILDRYNTGVLISAVTMQNAQPPEQVQASFDDAVRAKQDKERLKNEGEAYANDILPRARGLAAAKLEQANGYKQQVIANSQGDAARFSSVVAEYERAPQVTRDRIYIDTMQQIMQNTSKIMVDQKGGQNLLYLPLDKMIQMTNPGQPMIEPTRAAEPAPAAAATEAPRRDLRNRDNR